MKIELPPVGNVGDQRRSDSLYEQGPLIDVVITALPCWTGDSPTTTSLHGKGLLDTGSDITFVRESDLVKVAQKQTGSLGRTTGGGKAKFYRYRGICLTFPQLRNQRFALREAYGNAQMENSPVYVVIGRDVLQYLSVVYDGITGIISIECPEVGNVISLQRIVAQ